MATDNHYISDQLLAAYLDGNTTVFETHQVLDTIRNDPELQEVLNIAMQINEALLSPDSFVKSAQKKSGGFNNPPPICFKKSANGLLLKDLQFFINLRTKLRLSP